MSTPSMIGKRIQRLRVANGLNQAEFARASGIATGVVSMVENGRQAADATMLESMASVLACDSTYFTRAGRELVGTRPWLRAYADASKRAVDRYVADTHAAIEVIEATSLKSMPELIPTFDADLNDDDAIEEFAGAVREAAKLEAGDVVGNSIRAAERLGCVVLPMDDELGRHMGMSMRVNAYPVIRVSRPYVEGETGDGEKIVLPSGDRQRFTVAHELAHLSLHATCPPPATAEDGTRYEKQAHRFAGAFLAPAEPLLEDLRAAGGRVTLTTLQRLKSNWGVSLKMLVVRLRQLEQIDDHQARSLYKQISARKWNKVEPVPVGNETAIWMHRALVKAYRGGPDQRTDELDMAAAHVGLDRTYLDRWVDWSVRQESEVASVAHLPGRRDERNDQETAESGRHSEIHFLRRR